MPGLGERGLFREVVDDEGGLRVAVVHWCERGEALLACRVPDLELDGARGEREFLGQEGGADGGFFAGVELGGGEAEDEGGLEAG